jgi:hypothetical protein
VYSSHVAAKATARPTARQIQPTAPETREAIRAPTRGKVTEEPIHPICPQRSFSAARATAATTSRM